MCIFVLNVYYALNFYTEKCVCVCPCVYIKVPLSRNFVIKKLHLSLSFQKCIKHYYALYSHNINGCYLCNYNTWCLISFGVKCCLVWCEILYNMPEGGKSTVEIGEMYSSELNIMHKNITPKL